MILIIRTRFSEKCLLSLLGWRKSKLKRGFMNSLSNKIAWVLCIGLVVVGLASMIDMPNFKSEIEEKLTERAPFFSDKPKREIELLYAENKGVKGEFVGDIFKGQLLRRAEFKNSGGSERAYALLHEYEIKSFGANDEKKPRFEIEKIETTTLEVETSDRLLLYMSMLKNGVISTNAEIPAYLKGNYFWIKDINLVYKKQYSRSFTFSVPITTKKTEVDKEEGEVEFGKVCITLNYNHEKDAFLKSDIETVFDLEKPVNVVFKPQTVLFEDIDFAFAYCQITLEGIGFVSQSYESD
tara:strand:+ start:1561 stop:2448 length:888 start_codon:yes stop_codon:yes gene_type:complete